MTRLWQALERIDDVATSYASWRLMLGDEYDQYCDLLTPMNQFAKSLPVPGRPYQSIEIIEVDDGVFEGYDEKTESYLSVDRRDIVCYEFRLIGWPLNLANRLASTCRSNNFRVHGIAIVSATVGTLRSGFRVLPCQSMRSPATGWLCRRFSERTRSTLRVVCHFQSHA